tara:strand:+ start:2236 stop:3996 length:1761 start_codon:yes stop_codon:yes gene_type:complete
MAIIPNVKLNISYSLDSSTPQFVFTDVTSYGSFTGVVGTINVTSPSGVTSSGSITVSTSRINQSISIPVLADLTPEIGMYSFSYSVVTGSDTGSYSKTFNFQYVKPKVGITAVVDCLSPNLYTEDTTNYLVGSISPSDRFILSSVSASNNTFSVSGEKSAFVRTGDTFSIISSTGNNGDYTVTGVVYNRVTNETVVSVSSVVDGTQDGTLVTRKAKIFYPQVLGLNPLVGYTKKLSTSTFYNKTQEFNYVTKGFYDYGDGVSIVDSFTDSTELDIECDVRLCEVFCCINSVFKEYLGLRSRNKTLADIALEKYILATSHLAALKEAFECGQSAAVDLLVSEIKTVTSCTDDCSCSDTQPALITGLGSGGSSTVVAPGSNDINVASSVSGDTTTYTLTLSPTILAAINAVGNTAEVTGDSTITVTPSTSGSVTTYSLSVPASSSSTAPKEFMAFDVEADFVNNTFTFDNVTIQNKSNLKSLGLTVSDGNSGSPDNHSQVIKISGFQNTANSTYKSFVSNTYVSGVFNPFVGTPSSIRYSGVGSMSATNMITQKISGEFEFVILSADQILTKEEVVGSTFKFNIQIIQ